MLTIEEIENILKEHYNIEDDYDEQSGCFINGEWLSIAEIIETLQKEV